MRRYFAGDISANFSIDLGSLPEQGIYTIPQLWYYRTVNNYDNGGIDNWLSDGGRIPTISGDGGNNGNGSNNGDGGNQSKTFDDLGPFNYNYDIAYKVPYTDPNSESKNGTGLSYHVEWGNYGLIDSFDTYSGNLTATTRYIGALSNTVSLYRNKSSNIIDYFGNCDQKSEDLITDINVGLTDEDNPCSIGFFVYLLLIDSTNKEEGIKYIYKINMRLYSENVYISDPLPDNNINRTTLLNNLVKNSFKVPKPFLITNIKPTTREELLGLIPTTTLNYTIENDQYGIVKKLVVDHNDAITMKLPLINYQAYIKNVVKDGYYYLSTYSIGGGLISNIFYYYAPNINITINSMSNVYYAASEATYISGSEMTITGNIIKDFTFIKTNNFKDFEIDNTDYDYISNDTFTYYAASANIVSDVINNNHIDLKDAIGDSTNSINVYGDTNHINRYEININNLEEYVGLGNIYLGSSTGRIKKQGSTYYTTYRLAKQGYSPSAGSIINVEKNFIIKSSDSTNWEILTEFPNGYSTSYNDTFILDIINDVPDAYPLLFIKTPGHNLLILNLDDLMFSNVYIVNDLVIPKVPEYISYYSKGIIIKLYYDDLCKSILLVASIQYKQYSYSSYEYKQVFYRVI